MIAALAGLALACRHPLAPGVAALAFASWCAAAARWPNAWLAVVPAVLPLANLSPWTGWLGIDEFDLVVLGTIAGGYARWAATPAAPGRTNPATGAVLAAAAFTALSGIAFVRGAIDAGGLRFDLFQGYGEPLNAWRVFKPLPYALLTAPLAWRLVAADGIEASRRFAIGMLGGLFVVSLAVLWERAAYPGLLDWGDPYRATALFWEMHVGGAAIDGYLVLTVPFLAWALGMARTPTIWAGAAALALLAAHAVLATFSRGVYGALAVSLLLLAAWRRGRPRPPAPRWRRRANALLAIALAFECAAVLIASTFARERVVDSMADFGGRIVHWRRGLGLPQGAGEWLFGIGTGRLPARYMQSLDGHERSGALHLVDRGGTGHAAWLSGPGHRRVLGSRHAMAQRVDLTPGPHEVQLGVRALRDADLLVRVCERHLLYARSCASAVVPVRAGTGGRQRLSAVLAPSAEMPSRGEWYAPRLGLFTLSVLTPGAAVEVTHASLRDAAGTELLVNGDFAAGLARWFPAAQRYFLPWHVDGVYLEVLIERGALAFVAFAALLACAVRGALRARDGPCGEVAPYVAAALCGAALLGLVSSLLDMPRVAWLLLLMALMAAAAAPRR